MSSIILSSIAGTGVSRVDFNGTQDLKTVIFNGTTVYNRQISFTCQVSLTASMIYGDYYEVATCGYDWYDYVALVPTNLTLTAYNYKRIKLLRLTGIRISNPNTITASNYGTFTNRDYVTSLSSTIVSGTKYTLLNGIGSGDIPSNAIAYLYDSSISSTKIDGDGTTLSVFLYFEATDDSDVGSFDMTAYVKLNTLEWPITIENSTSYGTLLTNTNTVTRYNKDLYLKF